MQKSHFTETQIVSTLIEAVDGMLVRDVFRKHGTSPASDYSRKSK